MARRKTERHATTKRRADAFLDAGRLDRAVEEYRAAIALDDTDACSYFGLADAYYRKGMIDDAIRELQVAMRLKPRWPFYHKRMGILMEAAGRTEEATREYAEALRLKPDIEGVRESLARVSGLVSQDSLNTLIHYRKLYDVVRLAVELDIFTGLCRPATQEDFAAQMGTDARFIRYLLTALARSGYVETVKTDGKQCFMNTVASSLYLSRDSPAYIGDEVFTDMETYDSLRRYADEGPEERAITKKYWTPELLNNIGAFALLGHVQETVEAVDLSGRETMLDIGGGHGLYSIFFTERYPGLKAWVLDLPAVADVARENIGKYGAADRVRFVKGDFRNLGRGRKKFDVVLISNVTASYDELCALVADACGRLVPGGMLVLRNYVSDTGSDAWSPLIVLDRYSRRGRRGFTVRQLRSAMVAGGLERISVLYEGDGVAILSGVTS